MADPLVDRSIEGGAERANELIAREAAVAYDEFAGYLIAEGDSWFDYPAFQDIVEALEKVHQFRVRSAAHHGDTAEGMAYEDNQLDKTRRVFAEQAELDDPPGSKTPKAIVLSAGGNDLAHIMDAILNHSRSGLPIVNDDIVRGLLDVRVKAAMCSLISSLIAFSEHYFKKKLPIIVHGYGYVVPDGRGFPILGLSGPWLKPGFKAKGYVTADPQSPAELERNAEIMRALIDRFNVIVASLPAVPAFAGVVKYADLRPAFSFAIPGDAYQQDWRDEMHATTRGFRSAARIIADLI